MKPIEKLLKSNYSIWQYASKGMKEFKCKRCGDCCRTVSCITLTPDEYLYFKDKISLVKKKHKDIYLPYIKASPCPFIKDNNCSIYDNRPIVCKLFPLKLSKDNFPYILKFCVHSTCTGICNNEMTKLTYDDYLYYIKYIISNKNESLWIDYQDDISKLEDVEINDITFNKRTWCSVCNREFNDENNHNHKNPEGIDEYLRYINYISELYDKKSLMLKLYELLWH